MVEPIDLDRFRKQKKHAHLTMREMADAMRCSVLTLRRRIAQKRLKGVVYIDPFKNGRLLFERASVDRFMETRALATAREYDASVYLDRR